MKVDAQGNVTMGMLDLRERDETLAALRLTRPHQSMFKDGGDIVGISRQAFRARFHRFFGPGRLKTNKGMVI